MISTDPAPRRIAYGPYPDQFGDLYLPGTAALPLPVVAVIHGGWWKDNQTLDSYPTRALVSWLAARGDVAVWNLEFRRMEAAGGNTSAPWPASLADVAAGIDRLADMPAIDPGRLVAIGHSAGAHLAAWAACRPALPEDSGLRGARPVVPRAVGLLAGVLDLGRPQDLEQPAQVTRFLGGAPDEQPGRLAQSCPAILGRGLGLQGFCLHGDADAVVSIRQAEKFVRAAGPGVALHRLTGGTHFSMLPGETMILSHWQKLTDTAGNLLTRIRT